MALFWLLPAQAAIESVTVFPDRASVTRVVRMNVEAGAGEMVQSDLPVALAGDSLRIDAVGPEGLRLGVYRLETIRGSERVSERARALEKQIEQRRDELSAIDDDIRASQLQLSLLESLASGAGQGDGRLAIDGWAEAIERLGDSSAEVLARKRDHQIRQRQVSKDIRRLEQELADLGQRQRDSLELRLAFESPAAGEIEFTIEYTVTGAAWRPVYEWRLDTEEDELTIVQLAEVRQRSGEDWSSAEINLSLSRPAAGGRLPEPGPWWISVLEPEPKVAQRAREEASPELFATAVSAPQADQASAQWNSAELAGGEYSQVWRVPGRASVASDNQPHRFRLDQHRLAVALSARSVPRYQAAAWLFAQGTWTGDAALPPGPATLYQDHTLVGQVRFDGLAPGQELASSFGVDDRISVDYELIADNRAVEGMLRKSTVLTRSHRIRVRNGHSRPIALTVVDTMPVARDERIQVSMTGETPAPDRRDLDDRPGVLAWDRELAAGQELEMTVGYRLSFPEDLPGIQGW